MLSKKQKDEIAQDFTTVLHRTSELSSKDFSAAIRGLAMLSTAIVGLDVPQEFKFDMLESIAQMKVTITEMEHKCKQAILISSQESYNKFMLTK